MELRITLRRRLWRLKDTINLLIGKSLVLLQTLGLLLNKGIGGPLESSSLRCFVDSRHSGTADRL